MPLDFFLVLFSSTRLTPFYGCFSFFLLLLIKAPFSTSRIIPPRVNKVNIGNISPKSEAHKVHQVPCYLGAQYALGIEVKGSTPEMVYVNSGRMCNGKETLQTKLNTVAE